MKKLILISVLIVSFFGASAQDQRYFYERPTLGASSKYDTILNSDLPYKLKPISNLLTGAGVANYAFVADGDGTLPTLVPRLANPLTLNNQMLRFDGSAFQAVAAPTTSGHVLSYNGTSILWAAPSGGGVTPAALTKADDTNVTLTLGGTPATALLQATSITAGWTGQLSVARGGTGTATPGLVQGTNVTITGTWPNQTINASGGGGGTWGSITGTLSDQTDLQTALNGKLATGLAYLLASGGTASGANDFISTTTNTITNSTTSLGAYSSPTPGAGGAYFRNTTVAAAGAQQYSPALLLEGQGWKTNATAASQSVRFAQYVIPVQGASNPAATLYWRTSYNGGSYFSAMNLAVNELNTSATLTVNGTGAFGPLQAMTGVFSSSISSATTITATQGMVTGAFTTGYAAKTALYTLTATDHTIEVTSGTHTQTLPTAVGITGKIYFITNSGAGVVTVGTSASQTFVNRSGTPTTLTLNQFAGAMVQSNGANWIVLSIF